MSKNTTGIDTRKRLHISYSPHRLQVSGDQVRDTFETAGELNPVAMGVVRDGAELVVISPDDGSVQIDNN